ncbi:Phytochrome-like protein cph1 [Acaryochloris thomasi RCC1774]|uniref:histidine kinase n=1 Tax=Acaryochloris thomasi RCC1774 TaxID=1764569 RepID=A0A2W1JYS7_9CYAN|nr:hybrid sensor histidine kinase/response regulator [Acaryochloris thomasi]PZD75122.1 Phytochrome-like protein cph1 [Acaryochloris thomasi RCC1774]
MPALSILVVEDSPSDTNLLRQIFIRTGRVDWSLTTAERLSEGLEIAQQSYFDVVLLDLSLPDSEGLETVSTFVERVPKLPIVVLTIADDEQLALDAIHQGAQDYLVKGEITSALLVRAIQHGIERERLVRQLREANAELASFSYSVAHDLRSPLRAIEGISQALKEDYADVLDERGIDYTDRIIDSTTRLSRLIEDLLTYSGLGKAELSVGTVDLNVAIADALTLIETDIEQQQAEIKVEPSLPSVKGNQQTLVQVISNLLSNAIKFVPKATQPHIYLHAEQVDSPPQRSQSSRDTWVRLWIEDNGIGIAPQHQERIFGVFERLHGQESYAGTGIGLAIVKKCIEHLGGRAAVESQLGQGSQFWIELPKSQ